MAKVAVVVRTICGFDTPNCFPSVSTKNTTTKKSNASSVQPRNPASTAWCERFGFVGEICPMVRSQESSHFESLHRRPRHASRKNSLQQLVALHNRHSIHQHKRNSRGVLHRLVARRLVNHLFRIQDRYLGIRADTDSSLLTKQRRAFFQPLRGHQRHFAQRGHQVQRLFVSYVMSQNARECCLSAWM